MFMIMLIVITFIHSKLGAQVIIEDYAKCPTTKYTLLLLNSFICYSFAAISILAVLKLHFLDVVSSL